MNNIPSENVLSSPQLAHSQITSLSMHSGYDYEFVEKLDAKYECSICLLALRNPMQTTCGHRFCSDCILSCINGCNKECPIDKLPLNENGLFPDSCIEREILQLKVRCPNASLGCTNVVDLRYIEDHIHACMYQPVLCPNECRLTVLQKELSVHLTDHCSERIAECKYCDVTFPWSQEQVHLSECRLVSISCDLCSKLMSRSKLAEHKKEFCPLAEVPCSFLEHGCNFRAKRIEMKSHSDGASGHHIQLLSAAYKKINTLVLDLYRNVWQVAAGNFTRQPSLRSQVSQLSISDEQNTTSSVDNGLVGVEGGQAGHHQPWSPGADEKQEWNCDGELKQFQQSIMNSPKKNDDKDAKPSASSKHSAELPHSSGHGLLLRNLSDKSLDMDQRILESMIKVDDLGRKIEAFELNLRSLARGEADKYCHGTYVWKIAKFSEVCNSMDKKNKVSYSHPFYSSQFGYKFCLRMNLNHLEGEKYIALYIHMMQSENDDFLEWPFLGKISLALIDCKEGSGKQHFVENIDVNEPFDAFKRPGTMRNIKGYGYKEFIRLDTVLHSGTCQYLKDDVLTIKADVVSQTTDINSFCVF